MSFDDDARDAARWRMARYGRARGTQERSERRWVDALDEQVIDALLAKETAVCSLCAGKESPGFHTGCLYEDEGRKPINGWVCDGQGNLRRAD